MKSRTCNLFATLLNCLFILFLAACSAPNKQGTINEPPTEPSVIEEVLPAPDLSPQEPIIDEPAKIIINPEAVTGRNTSVIARPATEIIGEIEPVTIVRAKMIKQARIDTGATTSSLDVEDYTEFERDGKKWVRYHLLERTTGEVAELENRIIKFVLIKRIDAESHRRPVIRLKVRLGNKTLTEEFTLADRSQLDFPVLIGRNILDSNFIVDVSRKNTTSSMAEE
ncbi:ATP-dependent zinc protease [Desulfosediminicola sp.]|uniref:ATP-dependent zinc protease family protein n=1 Tax=Desulfosediminicola sp. TaxID=2886825 RepID=UPI003AF27147